MRANNCQRLASPLPATFPTGGSFEDALKESEIRNK